MTFTRPLALALALTVGGAAAATAQDFSMQIDARQGQFKIMALNLGVLGGMARGEIDYDAEAAQRAADTIVAISSVDQSLLWPEGSDNFALDTTRAEPSIWEDNADFLAKWTQMGEAAVAMQQAAADPDALGGALRQLGGSCGACHDAHRGPELE